MLGNIAHKSDAVSPPTQYPIRDTPNVTSNMRDGYSIALSLLVKKVCHEPLPQVAFRSTDPARKSLVP